MARRDRLARAEDRASRARYGLLLAALAAVFLLQGIVTPGPGEAVFATALLGLTLLLALGVGEVRPAIFRAGVGVVLAMFTLSLVEAARGTSSGVVLNAANLLLVTLAPPAVVVGTLRRLQTRERVTIEAVTGALCLYLLLGMLFAYLYNLIGRADGTFFAGSVPTTGPRCLYFSFVTLTTVGYGDFTAASNLGHTLSVSEALIGQIYLVTIVSVVVANLGQSRRLNLNPRSRGRGRPPSEDDALSPVEDPPSESSVPLAEDP